MRLPFPPASLSGHNKGNYHAKAPVVRRHREAAEAATRAARFNVPAAGDILVTVTFYPPNRRGDRVNFPNRMKPYWDGVADGLEVNDNRFLPSFHFAQPDKLDPRVEITVGAA